MAEDVLQEKSMSEIIYKMTEESARFTKLLNYRTYGSLEIIQSAMRSALTPISVIVNVLGEVYCVIDKASICEIKIKQYVAECFGLEYFVFENTNVLKKANIDDQVIRHYALLLPLLRDINKKGNENISRDSKVMTLITSEWKEIDRKKEIRLVTDHLK